MADAITVDLPYAVPDIGVDRVAYYFLGQTIGDAYRAAVAGNANWYAWIKASAGLDDAHWQAAFGQAGGAAPDFGAPAGSRAAMRAALYALESPGGSSVTAQITVDASGAASITSPPPPTAAAVAPAPENVVSTAPASADLKVYADVMPTLSLGGVADTGAAAAPAPASSAASSTGRTILVVLAVLVGLWLLSRL
jgi:hypothetical protein